MSAVTYYILFAIIVATMLLVTLPMNMSTGSTLLLWLCILALPTIGMLRGWKMFQAGD